MRRAGRRDAGVLDLRKYANNRLVPRGTSVPKRALIIAGPRRLNYPQAPCVSVSHHFTKKEGSKVYKRALVGIVGAHGRG